jgi:hypothetical protein
MLTFMNLSELEAEALKLPVGERARFAGNLLQSLNEPSEEEHRRLSAEVSVGRDAHEHRVNHVFQKMPPTSAFRCEVEAPDLEAFVACLALGTLDAIRLGTWSLEAGTWTLARPAFLQNLKNAGLRTELLDVLERADELGALEALSGHSAAELELDKMIQAVRLCLKGTASNLWCAKWLGPDVSRAEGREL